MQRRPFILATLALFFALTFAPLCPLAEAQTAVKKEATTTRKAASVTLDFKDVELTDLIQTISEMTGKNFVYDDTVKGKVTIISPRGMSLDEAYQVFLSVLSVKGFTVIPAGKMNKVVRAQDAKENTVPTGSDAASSGAEQIVTRLVPVQNIDAATFATSILTPLIPKSGSVVAYAPTNTLIITDSMANIERLLKIIDELDVPGTSSNFDVIFLENASAEELALIGTQILAQGGTPTRRSRGTAATAPGKVLAYPRSNALIVLAEAEEIVTIRALVLSLDRKEMGTPRSNINVYYLENADAETLAKTLNEIISGVKSTQAKKVSGQAAAPTEPVSITADKATNALIINALPEDYDALKTIVKQLDIRRKQVFVEALILELSMEATQKLGSTLQGAAVSSTNGGVFGVSNQTTSSNIGMLASPASLLTTAVDGIMLGGFSKMVNVTVDGVTTQIPALSALINLSKTDTDVNIVSAPRLLTSDNEEAQIVVGSNVPIITSRLTNAVSTSTSSSSGLATSVSVERQDVALTLRFTPQVTEGNLVRLKIFQEITDLATSSVGSVDQVGPTFTKRLLQNTVVAEDGKTVVLGGLIGNSVQEVITKVPFFGDIPLIGWLFKRKSTTVKKTNLLIFITPRIVRNGEDLARVTQSNREAMNKFQSSEMNDSLKKNKYADAAMEQLKLSDPTLLESVPHE
ncbi:MAG: type II secretion system protein GspD [Deltaproteobacteria bacterium HGW-Deltaproteobacteria-4]|nr:MAG: type II secretion system protein GspD [Deltaproteobacteria bacterium HGW-Deltaproteobacteria-4]